MIWDVATLIAAWFIGWATGTAYVAWLEGRRQERLMREIETLIDSIKETEE